MVVAWITKLFAYGCIGILIEFFFTGVYSLFQKNWKATGYSYLWMLPVYGLTAIVLETISNAVDLPFYQKAFIYLPVIYGAEAISGLVIKSIIGVIPWNYGHSKLTPLGLINLKYAPFWIIVAMAFDPISDFLWKVILLASSIK
jgi:hypothetical protein